MIAEKDCLSCQVANGAVTPVGGFVYAGDLWTVNHVLPPASILGWLVLQPRRHIESLHAMNHAEQQQMAYLLPALDQTLRTLLAPVKVYVCLFAESAHCPHIHFHIIPRAHDLDSRGPDIFSYKPEVPIPEARIKKFVRQAQGQLKHLDPDLTAAT